MAPIGDEGTFNLFGFDGAGWYVGFHGWDGSRAYRGIARTTTFRRDSWQVDGNGGTPTDAVLDAGDTAGWRETWQAGGPVGAGAGAVLQEGSWYYQLAEFPDLSLGCTAGQTWDLGLFRARTVSSTAWEQLPGANPLVYSSRAGESGGASPWCNVEYPGLFRDDVTGTTYLSYGRATHDPGYDALYIYRLEWNRSMLHNGDFWRADTEGWRPQPGAAAQLEVKRDPNGSPDSTPYLALGCGAPTCDAGASVFQDVALHERRSGEVAFGGTFRADEGTGRLDLVVHQIDAAGTAIESTSVPVSVGSVYARARGTFELDHNARRLRFELYPRTPGTIRADNLYLTPQNGCTGPGYPAC